MLAPVAGEAFASWIDRAAFDLGIGPGQLVQHLGMECRASSATTRPLLFGVMLTPESLRGAREATALSAERLRAMHLERYAGGALDFTGLKEATESAVRYWARREWAQIHGSRACPRCLAESPAWPLWWWLEAAAVCPRHGCLLIDVCPACGIRLRRGNASRPRGLLTRTGPLDPALCGNRVLGSRGRAGLCQQVLADIAASAVDPTLVTAQRSVLDAADLRPSRLLGEEVTAADWFVAMRLLVAVVRLIAGEDDLNGSAAMPHAARESLAADLAYRRSMTWGGMHNRLRSGPAEAAEAAGLLTLVEPILACSGVDEARLLFEPWQAALAHQRRANNGTDPLRHFPRPRMLDELLATEMPRSYRVVGVVTHRRNRPAPLGLHQIPHLVGQRDYTELIAEHLPGTALSTGRRFAALAVARICGGRNWRDAAEQLAMDRHRAARASGVVVQRIPDVNAFWVAVGVLTERMAARGPVDYRARREALADLTKVSHSVLFGILHPFGQDVTRQRQRHAAAWVWENLTGGDGREAPAYQHGWEGASEESVREGRRKFAASLSDTAAAALTAWGEELLEQHRERSR
ncbi:TniQ family protein [Kitasatospora sp. NPDC004723]|uniref:TniQ family protein n=1 Tax=Kitasatospora sp. NPDC004723 TaxID=3154288 RepID=UPI0033B9AD5C